MAAISSSVRATYVCSTIEYEITRLRINFSQYLANEESLRVDLDRYHPM